MSQALIFALSDLLNRIEPRFKTQISPVVEGLISAIERGHVGLDVQTADESVLQALRALEGAPFLGSSFETKPLIWDEQTKILYLYRYLRYERDLAERILTMASMELPVSDWDKVRIGLNRFPGKGSFDRQKMAALVALTHQFAIITGGPGTGKTTTVLYLLAMILEQSSEILPKIAICAPTGKAAARLSESISGNLLRMQLPGSLLEAIPKTAQTLHRLLGYRPGGGFKYHATQPLPYDVVIVDEASMVDLPMMWHLIQALTPSSRLILLGDKDQLTSVEVGTVLADLCRPEMLDVFSSDMATLAEKVGLHIPKELVNSGIPPLANCITRLDVSWRFSDDKAIGRLAKAMNKVQPDTDLALEVLRSSSGELEFWELENPSQKVAFRDKLISEHVLPQIERVRKSKKSAERFSILAEHQVLAATRQGFFGVEPFNAEVERKLRRTLGFAGAWFDGKPVMVRRNDYLLNVFNGDVALLESTEEQQFLAIFREIVLKENESGLREAQERFRPLAVSRLPEVEASFAITVHKSQGSEFDAVSLMLPTSSGEGLTRQLIYTALTRAKSHFRLIGSVEVLLDGLQRDVKRASGLGARLWNFQMPNERKEGLISDIT